jgi:phage/plasmid-associated DNA primase
MTLFSGLHEVFVKYPAHNRVGYFDSAEKALAALADDTKYQAAWVSLNTAPGVPANFQLNRLYRASSRYRKTDYKGRQLLLVDADPKRGADTSSTDEQKAAALRQIHDVRDFLRNLGFPDPVLSDSGNGYHLLYRLNEPNDEATETLIRNFLAGLAAKFSNEESTIDAGNFEVNRVCKLYGSWARKGSDPRLWRQSAILEIPTHETELPAKEGWAREVVEEIFFEAVPRSTLESSLAELPVPRRTALGEMDDDAIRKLDWLRKLCETGSVEILNERRRGAEFIFDIVCPRDKSHGSTSNDSSTIVSYERKRGYAFCCLHASCSSHDLKNGLRHFSDFRRELDPNQLMSDRLPGIPDDCTHAKIASYFIGLDLAKKHLRIYNAGRMRTTFVGTRWDLDDQSNVLLMSALQPVCDRLRYDMFPPACKADNQNDYRRNLENHLFRTAVMGQIVPQLGSVRLEQLDANPYLIGMPGGMVADLRPAGQVRRMEREDFLTRRLRIVAKDEPAPCYEYFMRSISSSNDQPADEDWVAHMEMLLGYCLLGHYNFHIWPLWTGEGGNGKTELAKIIKAVLGDFCALVRWSELAHDERGGDSTQKRLYYKLLTSRVAIVEEMGQSVGIQRTLETSTVKQLTGGGEISGAAMRQNEVHGEIRFKMPTLMNQAPHIEPDPAFKRRVQVFPFRATFDESQNPGCVALAMERKNAPAALREFPDRLSMMLREERSGILFRWIEAARRFVAQGEHLRNQPTAVREATTAMFHEADLYGRFAEERLEFGPHTEYQVATAELAGAGETFQRESGIPLGFDMARLAVVLERRHCEASNNVYLNGKRCRGWLGVRLVPDQSVKVAC